MRGSIKLFTMFRIPVHLHWTFGLIFVYVFYLGYANGMNVWGTAWLTIFFLALFGCVLLHEYGHALTARQYGVNTQDIILTPIGGIARLERMPEKPVQEFLVAIAGPMVNVVIALLIFGFSRIIFQGNDWEMFKWVFQEQFNFSDEPNGREVLEETGWEPSGLMFYLPILMATNIALVVFNLIPAFPMDGGRILRALLAMRMERVQATQWAAWIGQAIAVFFVVYGLWAGPFTLALIGFFVFTTARAENSMVRLDSVLRKFKVADLARTQFTTLQQNDWMQTPIALVQQGLERHFLVVGFDEQPVGYLPEAEIIAAIKKKDLSAEISQYMQAPVYYVHPNDSLARVYHFLNQQNAPILAVRDDAGALTAVVDDTGIQNFLRLQLNKKS